MIETLLFGDNSFSQYDNSRILDSIIAFVITSKRFDDPLLVWQKCEELSSRHFIWKTSLHIFSIVSFLLK